MAQLLPILAGTRPGAVPAPSDPDRENGNAQFDFNRLGKLMYPNDGTFQMDTPRLDPRETSLLAGGRVVLERDAGMVMRDGVRLSCDIYRPSGPGAFPAVLEHIPYRKDDLRAADDEEFGIAFAREGIAYVRLDVRGTGNSGGFAEDEYSEAEQEDGVEAVAWISRSPWCNGSVGSWGKSYGGFACLQLAARRPPELKAIATVFATDDRYTDDMHFFGGAACALELAHYPMRILAMNALPPLQEPGEPDDEWQARWVKRADATPPWFERWLAEQTDSPYWRNGSLRPGYERVACPVLIVAGWRDGYRTAMLRLAENLQGAWRLLVGPWMHTLPDRGIPGPPYPFLPEMIRWFQRHLSTTDKGQASVTVGAGDQDRPRSVFFLCEFDPPSRPPRTVSGRWFSSDLWPDGVGEPMLLFACSDGTLGPASVTGEEKLTCPVDPSVGCMSGNWCPPPPSHGLPGDQRLDEARSLVFTTPPLEKPVNVFGSPVLQVRVEHPGPTAILSAKLSDVSPEGESQLVTTGVLNLAHRNGHDDPAPLDGPADVELALQSIGWRFRAGHRIRLTIATSDWPTVWPAPTSDALVIRFDPDRPCKLALPPLPRDARAFEPPPTPADGRQDGEWVRFIRPSAWRVIHDGLAATSGVEASDASAAQHPARGIRTEEMRTYRAQISGADPSTGVVEGSTAFRLSRPGLDIRSRATGRFRATADAFIYDVRLVLRANGRPLLRKRWRGSVPRQLC